MSTRLLKAGVVGIWLASSAWFIRYEALPDLFTDSGRGYHDLLSDQVLIQDSWMKILLNGSAVGYSHTKLDTDERSPLRKHRVSNEMILNVRLLGVNERIEADSEAFLDATYHLQKFQFRLSTKSTDMTIAGKRSRGNTFVLRINTGGTVRRAKIDLPDDTVIYSPMNEMALSRLAPGETMRIRTVNPLMMKPSWITVRGLPRETMTVGGRSIEVSVVECQAEDAISRSWIAADGRVLRLELPLGLVAEACGPDEAMAAGFGRTAAAQDLLRLAAVELEGIIRRPREAARLKLHLTAPSLDPMDLTSERQQVLQATDSGITLMTCRASFPAVGRATSEVPPGVRAFLSPSIFLQSDDPRIIERSQQIAAGAGDARETALRILEWVHTNVSKKPSPGVPSAVEVLRTMEGDCTEHTYLFVALARAAGLPAKVKVGLVYSDGMFYYHAWPAVYAGGWVEMDPTFGQAEADATHVALLEGELSQQAGLVRLLGRMKLKVLEEDDAARAP